MKKNLHFVVFLLTFHFAAAQGGGSQRIDAAKAAMMTNRLNLTTEQSQQFWPVYNEFDAKKREIRKALREIAGENSSLAQSDTKILANLKEGLILKQKEVDLEGEYLTKFLKVINVRQVAELYKTEQMFARLLIDRLNRRDRKDQPRD